MAREPMARAPLPFRDLLPYPREALRGDLTAAATVTVLSVPQALAYAVIAGLPPVMGLYAAAVPTIVGSLLRSSRHVITGPSNALSLLVGSIVAEQLGRDPATTALTLALLVGALQLTAGLLRLGTLADYISRPVVLGYVTGAAVLLIVGQLPNLTGTDKHAGAPFARVGAWVADLSRSDMRAIAIAGFTIAVIVGLRRVRPQWPGGLIATVASVALAVALEDGSGRVHAVGDLGEIPRRLPALTWPPLQDALTLLPAAFACALLSLVESASVARSIAARSRQRLDMSVEFFGQGAANLAGALFGAYPTSGSLARSTLNATSGARTRLAGTLGGVAMLVIPPLAGPAIAAIPIACLAGLICVVAVDLFDAPAIRAVWVSGRGDALTFACTTIGTWVLPLDVAIEVGIGLSLLGFLRQARMLVARNMGVDQNGVLQERAFQAGRDCAAIRVLHIEGSLFFGAAGELQAAIEAATADTDVRVLLLRLKRTRQLDVTTATVLAEAAERLRSQERHLVLAGLSSEAVALLDKTGLLARIGRDEVFASQPAWFEAMRAAMQRAVVLAGPHACGDRCPVRNYSDRRKA